MDYIAITPNPTGKVDVRPAFNTKTLLNAKNVPTTATSYATTWKGYDYLLVCATFYSNVVASVLVPGYYFDSTTSTARVIITDPVNSRQYDVYKDGDNGIFLKGSAAAGAAYGVAVYGMKVH